MRRTFGHWRKSTRTSRMTWSLQMSPGKKTLLCFEQKDPLDTVSALDADDAAPDNEVVKESETAIVEGEAVDLPEVDDDRKDEATLCDVVTEEVLVPAKGAPLTGWRVDRIPQGPGRMRLVSAPLWSLRPPTCELELWLIIQREMRAKWRADDLDAFAAQEERPSSWRLAKRWCGRLRSRGREGRATRIEFRWRWTRLFTACPCSSSNS